MTSQPCNGKSFVQTEKKVWTSQWSVILRTFYRQILSLLYSSFFFWNFRHRLARELLVVYPIFYTGLAPSNKWLFGISEPFTVCSKFFGSHFLPKRSNVNPPHANPRFWRFGIILAKMMSATGSWRHRAVFEIGKTMCFSFPFRDLVERSKIYPPGN